MVSRGGQGTLRINADISGALRSLERLEDRARGVGRRLDNLSGGTLGAGARIAGGVGGRAAGVAGGVGRTLGAGFGVGAGLAVFEQLVQRIFEQFEDTEILENLTDAFMLLFTALGPLIGVLLNALTPVIVALAPAIAPLAEALAPLVELMGGGLLFAVMALTPLLTLTAEGIAFVSVRLRDFVFGLLERVANALNRIPGVEIDLSNLQRDTFREAGRQLQEAQAGRAAEERMREMAAAERERRRAEREAERETRDAMRSMGEICARLELDGEVIATRTTRTQTFRDEGGL